MTTGFEIHAGQRSEARRLLEKLKKISMTAVEHQLLEEIFRRWLGDEELFGRMVREHVLQSAIVAVDEATRYGVTLEEILATGLRYGPQVRIDYSKMDNRHGSET